MKGMVFKQLSLVEDIEIRKFWSRNRVSFAGKLISGIKNFKKSRIGIETWKRKSIPKWK